MKYKINYIALAVLGMLLTFSCEDKDKQLFNDFEQGSIPLFAQEDDDSGLVNFLDPDQTMLSFNVTTEGLSPVSSVDVLLTYNNSETGTSETVIYSNVNNFPAPVKISLNDLLGAFSSDVVTQDSLSLGDTFVVGGAMKMVDGRYLNGGYSPSVFSKRPVTITYTVSCPSSIPVGKWEVHVVSSGATYTVNLTKVGGGTYQIDNFNLDYDLDFYGGFNDLAAAATFVDICNDLTLNGVEPNFKISWRGSGAYDPVAQTLTFGAITDVEYDEGPFKNGGGDWVLTYKP
jgi:hypothetical protein